MKQYTIKVTVTYQTPFWVGIFEREYSYILLSPLIAWNYRPFRTAIAIPTITTNFLIFGVSRENSQGSDDTRLNLSDSEDEGFEFNQ